MKLRPVSFPEVFIVHFKKPRGCEPLLYSVPYPIVHSALVAFGEEIVIFF